MTTTDAGRGRVFVHIGTPKSGTSFIQGSLLANSERLREDGVYCAARRQREVFRAAAEMRERYIRINKTAAELTGSWADLCARVRAFPGTSVVSHEQLGGASREQAEQMLAGLDGLDVHVVLTARDLARTFPAVWQQGVKHGVWRPFAEHQRLVVAGADHREKAAHFWHAHDVPSVLGRWGATLPPTNIHVVTVPPPGSDPAVLWRRFCSVLGVEADRYPPAFDRENVSLGVIEVEVLRRVNRHVRKRDEGRRLARLVNRYYARELLRRYESPRPRTPPSMLPLFQEIAAQWVDAIEAAGYDVAGRLDDLMPSAVVDDAFVDPDGVQPGEALDRAAGTIVDLLVEVERLRSELRTIRSDATQPPETRKAGGASRLLASLVRRTTASRTTRTTRPRSQP